MIKMVYLIHRQPELDAEEFSRYWRENHAPIAAKIPGLRRYVQNHSTAAPDGSSPPYDGVAELWFDDMESLDRAMASPEGQVAVADAEKCMDFSRMETISVDEVTVV